MQGIEQALADDEGTATPAVALLNLAREGRMLLDQMQDSVATLYGLDALYLEELEQTAERLQAVEQEYDALEPPDEDPRRTQLLAGISVKLMLQVLDAFLSAHELYPDVPFLTPRNHHGLMRRISRLPPPPAPQGLGRGKSTSIASSGKASKSASKTAPSFKPAVTRPAAAKPPAVEPAPPSPQPAAETTSTQDPIVPEAPGRILIRRR